MGSSVRNIPNAAVFFPAMIRSFSFSECCSAAVQKQGRRISKRESDLHIPKKMAQRPVGNRSDLELDESALGFQNLRHLLQVRPNFRIGHTGNGNSRDDAVGFSQNHRANLKS